MNDPRKQDPGTSDDEFARFRDQQLAKRRATQRNKKPGSGPITSQERARQEIQRLESGAHSRSRATARQAEDRARQELREQETRQAAPRPSGKMSRDVMLRGRAEVHARERADADLRRPTGKLSREAMDRAKREREALDAAEAVRMGRRPPRLDPPSDPAVRPTNASDADFEKFRKLQLRRKRLEAMGLDKNPDLKPDESAGAFFGTTPVERQQIRGATQSFRAEEIEDLGEHHDEVVSDLREVEGTVAEIPDPKRPPRAPDDWLERME